VSVRPWLAAAAYTALALVGTWPLGRGLASDVAWDLGDSVFVMWVLTWNHSQFLAVLGGDWSRIGSLFDANIFYPAPLTLAYSEPFLAQSLQSLPLYALTGNPILVYNLLFLSTFVLSGLGMYLFVRTLTGRDLAAFVAGALFAFAPYRIPQSSHLQVLSAQWMPFVLYGFHRYFDTRRLRPLLAAAAALIAQNLSCLYYLLYFSPFAGAYVLWEIGRRRLWRDRRMWVELCTAALVVTALTAPVLLPYVRVRDQLQLGRADDEVVRYSADVYSYVTAFTEQPVWGTLQTYAKPEGQLFPGLVTLMLALLGLRAARSSAPVAPPDTRAKLRRSRRWLAALLAVGAGLHLLAMAAALLLRRVTLDAGFVSLRASNIDRMAVTAAAFIAVLLFVSPGTRRRAASYWNDRGYFVAGLVAAVWLSLGPVPQSLGRPLDMAAAYGWLLEYVPGFDGVRVPARFAMIVVLMLSVLGGFGAAWLSRMRGGAALCVALIALLLVESLAWPFVVNGASPPPGYRQPEARLYPPARAPAVYAAAATLPETAVIADLPLGQPDFDIRAMYYSAIHRRKLLNGYSGFFPSGYGPLTIALAHIPEHAEASWQVLRGSGATHVLLHEGAYLDGEGTETSRALRARGASEVFRAGTDVLLALP
jgi:hypothetical protein